MSYSLKELRKLSFHNNADIASHMGVGIRTIYMWESGERAISAHTLKKLLSFYKADAPISMMDTLIPFNNKEKALVK